jgi:hypothetical protein
MEDIKKVNLANKVEVVTHKDATVEELKKMAPIQRTRPVITIVALEESVAGEEGVQVHKGYNYDVNADSLAEVADAMAELAVQVDSDKSMGDRAGGLLVTLIGEFYMKKLQEKKEVV